LVFYLCSTSAIATQKILNSPLKLLGASIKPLYLLSRHFYLLSRRFHKAIDPTVRCLTNFRQTLYINFNTLYIDLNTV
jgi:hypothetical protein